MKLGGGRVPRRTGSYERLVVVRKIRSLFKFKKQREGKELEDLRRVWK